MTKSMRIRLGLVLGLAAALAGCQGPCSKLESVNAPLLNANGVDLSRYVAVGTNLTAGFESGGLVDRHQIHSFPALFARQIGKTVTIPGGGGSFTQPTVNFDGIPALLEIKSYSPLIISNAGRSTGSPTNFDQNSAYHNLGVPGSILLDLVDTTHYHNTVPPVNRTNFGYWNLIQRNRGTILAQALSRLPTLISLEYGANEILGATTAGIPPGGYNFVNPPAGSNGSPLPESVILRLAEVNEARAEIAEMNAVVDSVALRPFVTRVDIAGLLADIAANGIRIGNNLYTSEFITGGLFSLDGVHPNDLGYALIANAMIDAVNSRFGSRIPRVTAAQYASPNASRARAAGPEARNPAALEGLEESMRMLYPRSR